MEMQKHSIEQGEKVVIVEDVMATGGMSYTTAHPPRDRIINKYFNIQNYATILSSGTSY